MQTSKTFDAIHGLVKRRNELLDRRDHVRRKLRGEIATSRTRTELEIEYWHTVGVADGIGQALQALREAGEKVGSAEYLVTFEGKS